MSYLSLLVIGWIMLLLGSTHIALGAANENIILPLPEFRGSRIYAHHGSPKQVSILSDAVDGSSIIKWSMLTLQSGKDIRPKTPQHICYIKPLGNIEFFEYSVSNIDWICATWYGENNKQKKKTYVRCVSSNVDNEIMEREKCAVKHVGTSFVNIAGTSVTLLLRSVPEPNNPLEYKTRLCALHLDPYYVRDFFVDGFLRTSDLRYNRIVIDYVKLFVFYTILTTNNELHIRLRKLRKDSPSFHPSIMTSFIFEPGVGNHIIPGISAQGPMTVYLANIAGTASAIRLLFFEATGISIWDVIFENNMVESRHTKSFFEYPTQYRDAKMTVLDHWITTGHHLLRTEANDIIIFEASNMERGPHRAVSVKDLKLENTQLLAGQLDPSTLFSESAAYLLFSKGSDRRLFRLVNDDNLPNTLEFSRKGGKLLLPAPIKFDHFNFHVFLEGPEEIKYGLASGRLSSENYFLIQKSIYGEQAVWRVDSEGIESYPDHYSQLPSFPPPILIIGEKDSFFLCYSVEEDKTVFFPVACGQLDGISPIPPRKVSIEGHHFAYYTSENGEVVYLIVVKKVVDEFAGPLKYSYHLGALQLDSLVYEEMDLNFFTQNIIYYSFIHEVKRSNVLLISIAYNAEVWIFAVQLRAKNDAQSGQFAGKVHALPELFKLNQQKETTCVGVSLDKLSTASEMKLHYYFSNGMVHAVELQMQHAAEELPMLRQLEYHRYELLHMKRPISIASVKGHGWRDVVTTTDNLVFLVNSQNWMGQHRGTDILQSLMGAVKIVDVVSPSPFRLVLLCSENGFPFLTSMKNTPKILSRQLHVRQLSGFDDQIIKDNRCIQNTFIWNEKY